MDYEKEYKSLVAKVKKAHQFAQTDSTKNVLEDILPQLRESEDERARKAALEGIEYLERKLGWDAIGDTDILDVKEYLEKQKEQKELPLMGGYADLYFDEWNQQKQNPTKRQCFEEGIRYARRLQKEQKPAEKQDYSGLNDLERAIHRGFLSAGGKKVPVTIIKETAKECLAQMKPAEWSEDWREEDIQTRFAFYTYKDDPSVLYLSNVFVEETSRNHGFGTRILKAAEKVAEAIGAITICLKVKQDSPANAWYRKRGYGYVAFEDGYDWLEKNLEYLKPAKPAEWSERDEKILNELLDHCNTENATWYNWLKSLRPKPHWKPSEQEKGALRTAIHILTDERNFPKAAAQLQNILNAFEGEESRKDWKPSEEQMEALQHAIDACESEWAYQDDELRSLLNDIKKL